MRSILRAALVLLPALTLSACASWRGDPKVTLTADDGFAQLQPTFTTAVFSRDDANTIHIYLTDINDLAQPTSSGVGLTGNILHIHMFLRPRAGRTPIAFTASNATITHVVLADGAYAIYSGGGFLLPDRFSNSESFAGRIEDATLRPIGATSGIADLLGWTTLSGSITASRDDDRADQLGAWLDAIRFSERLVRNNDVP